MLRRTPAAQLGIAALPVPAHLCIGAEGEAGLACDAVNLGRGEGRHGSASCERQCHRSLRRGQSAG